MKEVIRRGKQVMQNSEGCSYNSRFHSVLPFVGFKQRNSNWLMFLRDFSRCCIENEPRGSSIETWKSGDYGNNPSERGWCPGRMGAEMVRSCQILDIFCRLSQEELIGEYENLCY